MNTNPRRPTMSKLLAAAFARAAQLPPGEQDAGGRLLLAELGTKPHHRIRLRSARLIDALGDAALEEHREGRLRPLGDLRS